MALRADRVGVRQDQVDVHGRVTSPSFLNELLEDLPEWTDMPVWVNGTEEVLPSNTSVPVTSPILADIAYPDIRRDNQYFTYRESPTPVDGLAKIKSIKGNTLVWNQLVKNGNFASTSMWSVNNITTYSVANNTLTFSFSANDGFIGHAGIPLIKNHKYIWLMDFKTDLPSPYRENLKIQNYRNGGWTIANRVSNNNWNTYSTIFTFTEDSATVTAPLFRLVSYTDGAIEISNSNQIKNVQVFDLTKMGLDSITSVEEFISLFPLPYYAYNLGTLLSFNGTGIKTTGKNLVNPDDFVQGLINWQTGGLNTNVQWITSPFISILDATSVTVQGWKDGAEENFMVRFAEYDSSYNVVANTNNINVSSVAHYQRKVTLNANTKYVRFSCGFNNKTTTPQTFFATNRVMLEFGGTASDYESYTENTTSLPISTYFPTGMKSAGTVYDELLPTKAITRIGAVDLGSLAWSVNSTYGNIFQANLSDCKQYDSGVKANILCAKYETEVSGSNAVISTQPDKTIRVRANSTVICILDSTYSTAEALATALDGVYLYYELATPVELPTMSFE